MTCWELSAFQKKGTRVSDFRQGAGVWFVWQMTQRSWPRRIEVDCQAIPTPGMMVVTTGTIRHLAPKSLAQPLEHPVCEEIAFAGKRPTQPWAQIGDGMRGGLGGVCGGDEARRMNRAQDADPNARLPVPLTDDCGIDGEFHSLVSIPPRTALPRTFRSALSSWVDTLTRQNRNQSDE